MLLPADSFKPDYFSLDNEDSANPTATRPLSHVTGLSFLHAQHRCHHAFSGTGAGSRVNITPAMSASTMVWMTTPMAPRGPLAPSGRDMRWRSGLSRLARRVPLAPQSGQRQDHRRLCEELYTRPTPQRASRRRTLLAILKPSSPSREFQQKGTGSWNYFSE